MRTLQVGDVVEVVFRNKLERPVNLVLAGGLIPDSPAHLAAPVLPGHTVCASCTIRSGSERMLTSLHLAAKSLPTIHRAAFMIMPTTVCHAKCSRSWCWNGIRREGHSSTPLLRMLSARVQCLLVARNAGCNASGSTSAGEADVDCARRRGPRAARP